MNVKAGSVLDRRHVSPCCSFCRTPWKVLLVFYTLLQAGLCVCGVTISGTVQLVVGWGQGVICLLVFGTVWSCLFAASVSPSAACSWSWGCFHLLGVITCYNSSLKVLSQNWYQQDAIPPQIWAEATRNDLMFSWEIPNCLFFCKAFTYLVLCLLALIFFSVGYKIPKQ